MADSHVDPKGHVNHNKNYITKKTFSMLHFEVIQMAV